MRGLLSTLSCLCMIAVAAPAAAQTATRISQYNSWGTYSYQAQGGKVCYALSVPTKKVPDGLAHGDIFFFVSQKPGQNVAFEPQFISGYDMQTNSKVTVTVGNASFPMFIKGRSAWMENAAQEPQLIAAMRGGQTMQIKAKSSRGNDTSYEFNLSGISAALQSIGTCK